jgi:hypothetical protein
MTIKEIKDVILPYIDEPVINFEIEKNIFAELGGRLFFDLQLLF